MTSSVKAPISSKKRTQGSKKSKQLANRSSSNNETGKKQPQFVWILGKNERFEGPAKLFWPFFACYLLRTALKAALVLISVYLLSSI